jgi:hypothetical protein
MFAVLLGDGKSAGPTHLQMPVAPPCQPIRSLGLAAAAGPNMRRHWGGGRWRRVPCGLSRGEGAREEKIFVVGIV